MKTAPLISQPGSIAGKKKRSEMPSGQFSDLPRTVICPMNTGARFANSSVSP